MHIRRLSPIIMLLAGLLLALAACTESPSLKVGPTSTVHASTPIATATTPPSPTPTPFGGADAQLGPLPQTCPTGAIFTPHYLEPDLVKMLGAGPLWTSGIGAYKQVPLALVWTNDASTAHYQNGWSHKLLWVVATHLHGSVMIHGINLSNGAPVFPDADGAEASSTPMTMVLDPQDPKVISQDANRDDQWTQFPGVLTVPGAGCYSLVATWPGGSWHMTFAAGVVPG